MSILIKGCSVADSSRPEGYVTSQDILIEGNRISKITSAGVPETGVQTVIDGTDRLAIPGLVNAHTHSPENLPKGTKEQVPLELWLQDLFLIGDFSSREIYLSTMLGQIVGIEIPITRIIGKFKASQNRSDADADGAISGLRETGDAGDIAMAEIMASARGRR